MKKLGKRIGWGLLLVLSGLLLYGVFIEPRLLLEVKREEARVPALPAAWEGQRVAVLGDFQGGSFSTTSAPCARRWSRPSRPGRRWYGLSGTSSMMSTPTRWGRSLPRPFLSSGP